GGGSNRVLARLVGIWRRVGEVGWPGTGTVVRGSGALGNGLPGGVGDRGVGRVGAHRAYGRDWGRGIHVVCASWRERPRGIVPAGRSRSTSSRSSADGREKTPRKPKT